MNKKWDESQIPDQNGRVVIVTGASSGIGLETARALAEKGARVILAVRNENKGRNALQIINRRVPRAKLDLMKLDLADLNSIATFVAEFKTRFNRLDLLINNAGIMIPPYSRTKDGFELQMGTNHLGHFALSAQLFDILKHTPDARIVKVSSMAHRYGNINFDDLHWEKRKYKAWRAYGDSKLANLYFTYHLADLLNDKSISVKVSAAHPGWTATDLQRYSAFFQLANRFFAQNPAMCALPTLRAAIDPAVQCGDYFGPEGFKEIRGHPVKVDSNTHSKDSKMAQRLWQVSQELTNVSFNVN